MNNLITLWYLVLFGVSLTACSPRYYIPDTHNIPLISKKGTTNVSLAANVSRIELHSSHGLTKNVAIKANGGLYTRSNFSEESRVSSRFIEFGGGYFKPFAEYWIFETYGIFGVGKVENNFPRNRNDIFPTQGYLSTNLRRIGIQPNIGFKTEHLLAAFSTRIVHLSFHDIEGDLLFNNSNQRAYLLANDKHYLLEPALTVRGGFNGLGLGLQMGYSINLTDKNFRQYDSYFSFIFNYSF